MSIRNNKMWCSYLYMDQNIEHYGEWGWRIVNFIQCGVKTNLKNTVTNF